MLRPETSRGPEIVIWRRSTRRGSTPTKLACGVTPLPFATVEDDRFAARASQLQNSSLMSAQTGAGDYYEEEHVLATMVFQAMSSPAASAFSNQYVIPISRYIVVAMVRCPCASPRLPAHR